MGSDTDADQERELAVLGERRLGGGQGFAIRVGIDEHLDGVVDDQSLGGLLPGQEHVLAEAEAVSDLLDHGEGLDLGHT